MKLSIVIICWNDLRVIRDCLRSIYEGTGDLAFEVVVSDNGSTDGSVAAIRSEFPSARVVENGANLGFAKGNNAGIAAATGEYVLILNPDTIVHPGSLERLVAFADRHADAGAFGCQVRNLDGSYQESARRFQTVGRIWFSALGLHRLVGIRNAFPGESYAGWKGGTERLVDWQSGCCVMFRGDLLRRLGGFDEQFFYHCEEVDLCKRVWDAGYLVRFTPLASITHLGSQSVNRFPIRFALERLRSRYRYFYKHFGPSGARSVRYPTLAHLYLRRLGYGLLGLIRGSEAINGRMEMYRAVIFWNRRLDPVRFVERGEEPAGPAAAAEARPPAAV